MASLAQKTKHTIKSDRLFFSLLSVFCLLITNMTDVREYQSSLPWSALFFWGSPWFDLFWTADLKIAEVSHQQHLTEHRSHLWSLIITEPGWCCPSWHTCSYSMGATLCLQLQVQMWLAEHDSCGSESFTCPRKLKPEKCGSGTGSLLRWRMLWKRGPGTGAVRKSFAGWLAWPWKQMFPFSSLAHVSQAASPGVHTVSRRGW